MLAKDLTRAGKTVIVLERGDDSRLGMGNPLGMLTGKHVEMNIPKSMYTQTIEGDQVMIGTGLGGGTKMYAGAAFMPNHELWLKYGIDLRPYETEACFDAWVSDRPKEFLGEGTQKLMDASAKAGIPYHLAKAHARWDACTNCKHQVFGCRAKAKWEGYYPAKEAMLRGAKFLFKSEVINVIKEKGRAVGFKVKNLRKKSTFEVRAKVIVIACGGRGSAMLAKRAGIKNAGSWFTGDPMSNMLGFVKAGEKGSMDEAMFSASTDDHEHGLAFGGGGLPFTYWCFDFGMENPLGLITHLPKYKRMVHVFNKIHDDDQGWVDENGRMSKTYTKKDKEKFDYGWGMLEKILIEYGCDPKDLHRQPLVLGHPSGTVKIGPCLDIDLQSKEIPNLYVCDSSTFPEAIGAPPVLNLVCLAKYFKDHLVNNVLAGSTKTSTAIPSAV